MYGFRKGPIFDPSAISTSCNLWSDFSLPPPKFTRERIIYHLHNLSFCCRAGRFRVKNIKRGFNRFVLSFRVYYVPTYFDELSILTKIKYLLFFIARTPLLFFFHVNEQEEERLPRLSIIQLSFRSSLRISSIQSNPLFNLYIHRYRWTAVFQKCHVGRVIKFEKHRCKILLTSLPLRRWQSQIS